MIVEQTKITSMEFIDRKKEIAKLREIETISKKTAQFTIVSGRRRIGKTSLIKKAYEDKEMLYFFVARKAEAELCETFFEEIKSKLKNIVLPEAKINSFAKIFQFIMEVAQKRHITLFIDEFQEFFRINPSIFSDMQNIWDSLKHNARINLIVGGSVNTLLNRIFTNSKEPLFGRQTHTLRVRPFSPSVLRETMRKYNPDYKNEDLLALYTLTGGVAKYVELFVDHRQLTLHKMLRAVFQEDAYFLGEGKTLLIEEFGKDYGTYFSILSLIAQGRNTRSEIENALGGLEISGYLKKLIDDYELVGKQQPLFENAPNKSVHYRLSDSFLRFWFRFIYKYSHIIEAGGIESLRKIAERDYATFSGLSLEAWFRDSMRESGKYTRIGYWHDRKGENEIDIIAEDELKKRVEIIEVKRQRKNLNKTLLDEKAKVFLQTTGAYRGYSVTTRALCMEDM